MGLKFEATHTELGPLAVLRKTHGTQRCHTEHNGFLCKSSSQQRLGCGR
jgi:hypothetical protein